MIGVPGQIRDLLAVVAVALVVGGCTYVVIRSRGGGPRGARWGFGLSGATAAVLFVLALHTRT